MSILWGLLILQAWGLLAVQGQPAQLPFRSCLSNVEEAARDITVDGVFGQIVDPDTDTQRLRVDVLGHSQAPIEGFSNTSHRLATLFSTTSLLTYNINSTSSFFCSTLRPQSPIKPLAANLTYCPFTGGALGFSVTTPLSSAYQLTTLNTRIRVVDSSLNPRELLCIDFSATPIRPTPSSNYGHAVAVFWTSVGLSIGYFLVLGAARIASALDRGVGRSGSNWWSKTQRYGFLLASAISGDGFSTSPALIRFATPSTMDVIHHTQWVAALGMVAVDWPRFAYPILTNAAWSTLVYNVTLIQGQDAESKRWNPLHATYAPPTGFAGQMSDIQSPLYLDKALDNRFLILPGDASDGLSSYAPTIGLRPEDLFGTCLSIFLMIMAGTIVISGFIQFVDWIFSRMNRGQAAASGKPVPRSPRYNMTSERNGSKELPATERMTLEDGPLSPPPTRPASRATPVASRRWWKRRSGPSSFHGNILHGNLIRILLLFHFPITIFACHQFTLDRLRTTTAAIVLASLSFIIFSIALPAYLVFRIATIPTSKLFDETRTLLSLGPLYNKFSHGSQLFAVTFFANNLALAITIGAGQASGTAQSIVVLIVEVVSALATSVWLPYGHGAHMGVISFLFCVARIITAVLLVILSPTVAVGDQAAGWIAYAIIAIQALVYLAFFLMLLVKICEGLVRLAAGIPFGSSKQTVNTGLVGALVAAGLCGGRADKRSRQHQYRLSRNARANSMVKARGDAGSTTPLNQLSGPPSVLRPEHASRPYREDSDDESGFIMGAWRPFPQPAHSPTSGRFSDGPSAEGTTTSSGFARVAGGRAHFETPYAIVTPPGGTPSVHPYTAPLPDVAPAEEHELPWAKTQEEPTEQQPTVSPPLSPHYRRKSQTAVIEYYPPMPTTPNSGSSRNRSPQPPPPVIHVTHEDDEFPLPNRKKKAWFSFGGQRRLDSHSDSDVDEEGRVKDANAASTSSRWGFRSRRRSEGDEPPEQQALADPSAGRSFVVVRDPRRTSPSPTRASTSRFLVNRIPIPPLDPSLSNAPSSFVPPPQTSLSREHSLHRNSPSI